MRVVILYQNKNHKQQDTNMKDQSKSEMLVALDDFMSDRGWRASTCASCTRKFYTKETTSQRAVCGRNRCDDGLHDFRRLPGRKLPVAPSKVIDIMRASFMASGYAPEAAVPVASQHGRTDLVVAGVQMYDSVIHGNAPAREGKFFVAQPSVRTQFIPLIESEEGTSTSFVNACTEQMGATFVDHLFAVDSWCSVLSGLGLHMNDFVLVTKESSSDWGTGEFDGLEMFFHYGDLELGDASFVDVPLARGGSETISDIGFGLERVTWAMNKTDSYYDLLAPFSVPGSRVEIDACRTLSLLALSGITASNRGAGQQFRKFARILSEAGTREVPTMVEHFHEYWSRFPGKAVSASEAVRAVRLELDRPLNARLCESLRLPPPKGETTEAYLERLVYTCGISHHDLRKAIQSCKQ